MAITRLYSESHPDGAVVNAADLDTVIKEFKVDVRERAVGLGALDFAYVLVGAELAFDCRRVKSAAGGIKNADLTADILAWSAQRYVTAPAQPRCLLYNASGAVLVGTGTPTAILFTTEVYDNASMHDNASNTSRITIPTGGSGNYLVQGTFRPEATASALTLITSLQFYKNGAALALSNYATSRFSGTTTFNPQVMWTHNLSYVIPLVAGDYLELFYTSNLNLL